MNKFTIAAAALAAGLLTQTLGFTQVPVNPSISASTAADTATTADPEKAQRKMWRAVIRNTPGIRHMKASSPRHPDVAWQRVECKEAKPRVHHASRRP
jgi:hypothetical protein